jgi:hypothetical protein
MSPTWDVRARTWGRGGYAPGVVESDEGRFRYVNRFPLTIAPGFPAMGKRSAISIQNRLLERADRDTREPGQLCSLCGHPITQHHRMRNSSYCDGCKKLCAGVFPA